MMTGTERELEVCHNPFLWELRCKTRLTMSQFAKEYRLVIDLYLRPVKYVTLVINHEEEEDI